MFHAPRLFLPLGGALICLLAALAVGQPPPPSLSNSAGSDSARSAIPWTAGKVHHLLEKQHLTHWETIKQFDFEKHGPVEIKTHQVILGKGRPATGIVWKAEFPRQDYEISLDAKRVEGDDFFCGLTFPVGKSYLSLIIGGWGGGVTGLSNINGMSAVENETTGYTDFKRDRWYRIRLRVTPDEIQAWIDKERIISVDAKDRKFTIWWEQEPARPLGVVSWNTKAALRNITAKKLAVQAQPKEKRK